MDLTNKTYKICKFCKEFVYTYIKCTKCSIECHLECFYSQAHICNLCKYCAKVECIVKLKKRQKSLIVDKHALHLGLSQTTRKGKEKYAKDTLKNTIDQIERIKGQFKLLEYQILNKHCLNEIVIVFAESFIVSSALGSLFWNNFCKICCKIFHTTNENQNACLECQICCNCGIKGVDIANKTSNVQLKKKQMEKRPMKCKALKDESKDTLHIEEMDIKTTDADYFDQPGSVVMVAKATNDENPNLDCVNEVNTAKNSGLYEKASDIQSCEQSNEPVNYKFVKSAENTPTCDAEYRFLFEPIVKPSNQNFIFYKTNTRDFNFEQKNHLYCVTCHDNYVIKDEICPICMKQYTQDDMIECEWCLRWIHYNCLNNKKMVKTLKKAKDPTERYMCLICVQFEDAWLGNMEKMPSTKIIGKEKYAIDVFVNDSPSCILCDKNFNQIESILVAKKVIQDTNLQLYAHNICAYSCLMRKNEKTYIKPKYNDCQKCHKGGAHLKCIFCKNVYYHFDCAFDEDHDLFRSNIIFPICQKHYSECIGSINIIAENLSLLKFFVKKHKKIDRYRIDDFIIDENGCFTRFMDPGCNHRFYFDTKNFYMDDVKMTQNELDNKCKSLKLKFSIAETLEEYQALLDKHKIKCKKTKTKRYSLCIAKNVQEKNYTSSYISHLVKTNKDLEVKKSEIHGKGVFAKRLYYPHEVIINYEGAKISFDEADAYEKEYKNENYYMFKTSEEVIDATIIGNIAKFINQSCDPNCYSTQAVYGSKRGILICAGKFITVGEELTYKYMMSGNKLVCNCDSINCKKTLN